MTYSVNSYESSLKIVFHAHRDTAQIHPRNMFISAVGFKQVEGADQLFIDPNFQSPYIDAAK